MRNDGKSTGSTSNAYVRAVNRAIDHVLAHLDEPLPLEQVAAAAGFSAFHFHRVFRSLMGETVAHFVKRLRLERALKLMSQGPDRSLTEVALACGFGSSSDFSRSFKQRYGLPPSVFDVEVFRREQRAAWQEAVAEPGERHLLQGLPPGENPDGFAVELVDLPARTVAYRRVHDSFQPGVAQAAVEAMLAWADERGIAGGQWLGYMWEDPEIVAPELCRYDVGLVVEERFRDESVDWLQFPAMRVAQVELRGAIDLEVRAIDWFWRTWLPTSAYLPAEQPSFEAWMGRPFKDGDAWFELWLQVPVVEA